MGLAGHLGRENTLNWNTCLSLPLGEFGLLCLHGGLRALLLGLLHLLLLVLLDNFVVVTPLETDKVPDTKEELGGLF